VIGVLANTPRGFARRQWTLPALYAAAVAAFFLSLSIHRPWYLIPMLPFFSVFLGAGFARTLSGAPSPVVRIAIAVALALTAWIELPVFDVNPFIARAMNPPAVEGWASWLGVAPGVGVIATAVGIWLALEVVLRRWRPAVAAAALGGIVIAVAGTRVAVPLQYVDYLSGMERLSRSLEAQWRAGKSIEYPVIVPSRGRYRARYFFGDQFHIQRRPRSERVKGEVYALFPIGTSGSHRNWRELEPADGESADE
jgi:hypothetical protein